MMIKKQIQIDNINLIQMQLSREGVLASYKSLGDMDADIRVQANMWLMNLADHEQIWQISKEMIGLSGQDLQQQLLGAQLLYLKTERQLDQLEIDRRQELKQFIFNSIGSEQLAIPSVRKMASAGVLVAASLYITHWQQFIPQLVGWMSTSPLHLRNGMILLQRFPDELRKTNRIKHGIKLKIREDLMKHSKLLCHVFWSAMGLKEQKLTQLCVEAMQSWVVIGFPLFSFPNMVQILLELLETDDDSLEGCCKLFKQALKYTSQQRYQNITDLDQMTQKKQYSQEQRQSLGLLTQFLQKIIPNILAFLQKSIHQQKIEMISMIIKQLILSYQGLLKEKVGMELIELLFKILQSDDLKLSYSTFQFWLDFSQKLHKLDVESAVQEEFLKIVEYLYKTLLVKIKIDENSLMDSTSKDDDTLDDIQNISLQEYRKQATHLFKFIFTYLNSKKHEEGSLLYFRRLIELEQGQKNQGRMAIGLEASIFVLKAALEEMVKPYDTQNIVNFVEHVMLEIGGLDIPAKLVSQVLNLIKDTNRQIISKQTLFFACLQYSLKYVSHQNISYYAVYAFQGLMESISVLKDDRLVSGLIQFYSKSVFSKQTILEKIVEGILTTITKLTDKQAMQQYLMNIINGIENKFKMMMEGGQNGQSIYISLVEIKTLLNSFDQFKKEDRQIFKGMFMEIAKYGLSITAKVIQTYLQNEAKFMSVGDLGASLSVLRNALRLCDMCPLQTIPFQSFAGLMNIVSQIFVPNRFTMYCGMTDIIYRILVQFMDGNVAEFNQWIECYLPQISQFMEGEIQKVPLDKIEPDLVRYYLVVEEGILLYSRNYYLRQPQHMQIYRLAVQSIEHINQRNLQKKAISFLHHCLQLPQIYQSELQFTVKALFASIPQINNICHITLCKCFIILLGKVDLKTKENIFRQLLELDPYTQISKGLKEILAKFMAFAVESKVERYIKGCIVDLTELRWKDDGTDTALHLELRYAKWKMEFKSMQKKNQGKMEM